MHVCSFSGEAADLPRGKRTARDVLSTLSEHPRVSTWDMSETPWLRKRITELERGGLIESKNEPFPWHRYALTEAGEADLLFKLGRQSSD